MSSEFIKEWLNGLTEHMELMASKFSSQTAYANSIKVAGNYVSLVMNKRYNELSRTLIIEIAEKANYDRENLRKMGSALDTCDWRSIKKETATLYENTRRRERYTYSSDEGFISQNDVIENQKNSPPQNSSSPQDVYLVNRYLSMRNEIPFSKSEHPVLRRALLHNLCEDLTKLNEKDLC
jgi:hypothetical protein